ncbi:MAG: hypothetical protein QOJ81_568 [Chloroflexota bacterium]|jgi:hypothetical protein|nr:hypothetical protein [Chloroflexota bacterium]
MLMFDGRRDALSLLLRVAIVVLALSTAYIHWTLGGMMFVANSVVYVVLAGAMIAPLAIASRYRWLIRAALIVFALMTIGGWMMFGARIMLGYVDKAIEVGLIALLFVEMFRYDGGPLAVAQRGWELLMSVLRRLTGRSAA